MFKKGIIIYSSICTQVESVNGTSGSTKEILISVELFTDCNDMTFFRFDKELYL